MERIPAPKFRASGDLAAARRPAAPPVPARRRRAAVPPPRPRRRRLRGRLRQGEGARRCSTPARWYSHIYEHTSGLGADVHPRPGRQPRRDRLARRDDARPLRRHRHPQARRRRPRRPASRPTRRCTPPGRSASDGAGHAPAAASCGRWARATSCAGCPLALTVFAVVFALIYILFVTTARAGSAASGLADDELRLGGQRPERLPLHACSTRSPFAGPLFIVASGFTLIFGLMRVVNMAHGVVLSCSAATSRTTSSRT